MGKQVIRKSKDPSEDAPGLELLRAVAGYPHRSLVMNKQQMKSRVVQVQRDAFGQIVGSVERIEETEFTYLDGQWTE